MFGLPFSFPPDMILSKMIGTFILAILATLRDMSKYWAGVGSEGPAP